MSFLNRLLGKEDYEEKLLETLVDKGLISLDRAQELLVSVRNTGGRAAELIVKSGAVPEGVLMAFLARALKTAPLDVTKFPMRQNITSLITADVAVAGRLLPRICMMCPVQTNILVISSVPAKSLISP
jgi:hypothetical protein